MSAQVVSLGSQHTDSNPKPTKPRSPYQPAKRLYDAVATVYASLTEGVNRAKAIEKTVGVEFPQQASAIHPWDRLKNQKVVITLGLQKLTLQVLGHATDMPEGSQSERLIIVCKISDSVMRSCKFYDPAGTDKIKAEQTRMHQIIILREEGAGFVARISQSFLKRYTE